MFISDWKAYSGAFDFWINPEETGMSNFFLCERDGSGILRVGSMIPGHKYYGMMDVAKLIIPWREVNAVDDLPDPNKNTAKYLYSVGAVNEPKSFYEIIQNGDEYEYDLILDEIDVSSIKIWMTTHFNSDVAWLAARNGEGITGRTIESPSTPTRALGEEIWECTSDYLTLVSEMSMIADAPRKRITKFQTGKNMGVVLRTAIVDLTDIYGAGNEPSTLEEYKSEYSPTGSAEDTFSYNKITDNLWKYYSSSKYFSNPGRVGTTNA